MQQNGGTTNPLDSWNLRKEKAVSAMDVPHVFLFRSGYELPFGKGKPFASQESRRTSDPRRLAAERHIHAPKRLSHRRA